MITGGIALTLVSRDLAIFYMTPMILLRYRPNIIASIILSVQDLYKTSKTHVHANFTRNLKSYLSRLSALRSYLPTALRSYLPTSLRSYPEKWLSNLFTMRSRLGLPLVISLIVLLTSSSGANASLTEFGKSPTNKKSKNRKLSNSSDNLEEITKAAYGYVRQSQSSSDNDSGDTYSISVQKQHVCSKSEELGFKIANMFVDMNESGFSF